MSCILSFTDKTGKPATLTFPNRQVAEVYARGVKNPTFTDTAGVVETAITKCGSKKEEEAKRAAARANEPKGEDENYNICECGKRCSRNMTVCYTCRRYR